MCEVLGDLLRYSGKIIAVRGAYFGVDLLGPGTSATREPVPDETRCAPLMSHNFEWMAGIYIQPSKGGNVERQQPTQWTFDSDAGDQAIGH